MVMLGIVTLVLLAGPIDAKADTTRYVKEGGMGDGTTWANASKALQEMVDAVELAGGGTVWVASGTYMPTEMIHPGSPRSAAFQMKNGVKIYGGFPATGSPSWAERDWDANPTILTGELGNPGTITDNCYHVFYHPAALALSGSAVLDGFTITRGYADQSWPHNSGGGICNDGSGDGNQCSPSFYNCTVIDNWAVNDGGGMFNDGSESGLSNPVLMNCKIVGNYARIAGGGMYNNGAGGQSSPTMTDCIIIDNRAPNAFGGGLVNNGNSRGTSIPILTRCTINTNNAYVGGGIYNCSTHEGNSNPILNDCVITGNTVGRSGGGMYNSAGARGHVSPMLNNCTISYNTAALDGGGFLSSSSGTSTSSPVFTDCTIAENHTEGFGGGGCLDARGGSTGTPAFINCNIVGNTANAAGGGLAYYNMDMSRSNPILTDCIISDNSAGTDGGGLYNRDEDDSISTLILTACTISGNSAGSLGAGLFDRSAGGDGSNLSLNKCAILGNTAGGDGGGLCRWCDNNAICHSDISSCNVRGNEAIRGGGLYFVSRYGSAAHSELSNCIVSGNNASANEGGGIWVGTTDGGTSELLATNTTIAGNRSLYWGGGLHVFSDGNDNSPVLTNCIIWGNHADNYADQVSNQDASPSFSYCNIQDSGGSASWDASLGTDNGHNSEANPMLVDVPDFNNAPTIDGDVHLDYGSPCIDSGSNGAVAGIVQDFDGDARITGGTVDMGAYEYAGWSAWDYDLNENGRIDYSEMVNALMDYLLSNISYGQMVNVLMLYLTT